MDHGSISTQASTTTASSAKDIVMMPAPLLTCAERRHRVCAHCDRCSTCGERCLKDCPGDPRTAYRTEKERALAAGNRMVLNAPPDMTTAQLADAKAQLERMSLQAAQSKGRNKRGRPKKVL